jgi:anti-sigma regulatory factor (Ser/Thr protein kinase)
MAEDVLSVQLIPNLSELERVISLLKDFCDRHRLPESDGFRIRLAVEEIITNSIKYSSLDSGDLTLDVHVFFHPRKVTVQIEDDGIPFNPLSMGEPDVDSELDKRKAGGLGIHFLRHLMDGVSYERREGKNILRMTKSISEPS